LQVKSPTSDLLKIERQITSLPDGNKSVKGTIYVPGTQPIEMEGLINFSSGKEYIPVGSKHSIYRKSKYSLELCGIVIDLLVNKLLCLRFLYSEVFFFLNVS
jgi:hypothetical protein